MHPFDEQIPESGDVETLRGQLRELEDIVHAIREGIVDAFVVGENQQERIYTLTGIDHPYRILVESMHDGAAALNHDGRIIYANPSLGRILETSIEAIVGSTFDRFVAPADLDRYRTMLAHGAGDSAEVKLLTGDGQELPVNLSSQSADLGNVKGLSLVVTDLSHQKKHDQIVASERLARAILAQAAEAIVVCDESGVVTHASKPAETLCGRALVGERFQDVFPLSDDDGVVEIDAILGRPDGIAGHEVRFTCADDRVASLLLSSSPLVDDAGSVLGTVLILTDFTERKQAEQTLRNLNEVLEERIAQRTETLEQRNRELQSFAFVASHDLQEPLRKIQSFASLFRSDHEDRLDEQGQFYLDRIENAAARMSQLLADVLAFSRISTRQQPFEIVSLDEVLQDALMDLEVVIAETKATVDVDAPVSLSCDRSQIRQLMNHLVQNAIKFRRAGLNPHVRISAQMETDVVASRHPADGAPRRICRIVVEDNGIGFQPRFVERIFEPLQRLHARDAYPGTGIGLAICRRIVERHDGRITATSVPGQGSRFEVVLPLSSE